MELRGKNEDLDHDEHRGFLPLTPDTFHIPNSPSICLRYNIFFPKGIAVTKAFTQRIDPALGNEQLAGADPARIVKWATEHFDQTVAMTSSFGAQSAVMLHLVTRAIPDIPVILIDTGFLFPETYRFVETLTEKLKLNLKVYQSPISPARMVALHGQMWEQGKEGLDRYHRMRKVEPLREAFEQLKVTAWLAGLRRDQTHYRRSLSIVDVQDGITKILPLLDWSRRQMHAYLAEHGLPYHPLHEKGYVSLGDWHTTRPLIPQDTHERQTRFQGLKQECGIHLPQTEQENESRGSSNL